MRFILIKMGRSFSKATQQQDTNRWAVFKGKKRKAVPLVGEHTVTVSQSSMYTLLNPRLRHTASSAVDLPRVPAQLTAERNQLIAPEAIS